VLVKKQACPRSRLSDPHIELPTAWGVPKEILQRGPCPMTETQVNGSEKPPFS